MIHKNIILYNEKLVYCWFSIIKNDNKIIIKIQDIKNDIIKIPVYNKHNGLDYIPVCFPIEYIIIDNSVFNPYIILSSYNIQNNNDIDFFNNINRLIINKFKFNIITFDNFLNNPKFNLINILNNNYNVNLEMNKIILSEFIKKLWFNINIIKLYITFILINHPINKKKLHNNPKIIQKISNNLLNFKYSLTNINSEYNMSLKEYINYDYSTHLVLDDLKINNYYFIKTKNTKNTKFRIFINTITENIINNKIIFENNEWYYYSNINISKSFIIYQTNINNNFTNEIIKNMIGINDTNIIKYYMIDDKLNNLKLLSNINIELKIFMDDINILKTNSYDSDFIKYITTKYTANEKIYEILEILFNNYMYPFKQNRYNIETTFDYIMYISIHNSKIIINNKNPFILNSKINNIIPFKIKKIYINFLKIIQTLIQEDYNLINFNNIFYTDHLHKKIIKLLLGNTDSLTVLLFKEIIPSKIYNRFKEIIINNLLLIDISNKLTLATIQIKLNYLDFYYINSDIIYYHHKINKNLIPNNFDIKIKKIIENPFEMYKNIKNENEFIIWTHFISNRVDELYLVPLFLNFEDFDNIGKLIYLLFNITEQNLNNQTYKDFLIFCNLHKKIILTSTRINLRINDFFQNIKINLGFLAKHLTLDQIKTYYINENIN